MDDPTLGFFGLSSTPLSSHVAALREEARSREAAVQSLTAALERFPDAALVSVDLVVSRAAHEVADRLDPEGGPFRFLGLAAIYLEVGGARVYSARPVSPRLALAAVVNDGSRRPAIELLRETAPQVEAELEQARQRAEARKAVADRALSPKSPPIG